MPLLLGHRPSLCIISSRMVYGPFSGLWAITHAGPGCAGWVITTVNAVGTNCLTINMKSTKRVIIKTLHLKLYGKPSFNRAVASQPFITPSGPEEPNENGNFVNALYLPSDSAVRFLC
jgi:hypothetical protein